MAALSRVSVSMDADSCDVRPLGVDVETGVARTVEISCVRLSPQLLQNFDPSAISTLQFLQVVGRLCTRCEDSPNLRRVKWQRQASDGSDGGFVTLAGRAFRAEVLQHLIHQDT